MTIKSAIETEAPPLELWDVLISVRDARVVESKEGSFAAQELWGAKRIREPLLRKNVKTLEKL